MLPVAWDVAENLRLHAAKLSLRSDEGTSTPLHTVRRTLRFQHSATGATELQIT